MRRAALLLLVMALMTTAAGCGDNVLGEDAGTTAAPVSSDVPATTEAPPTSEAPATTATPPPPTTTTAPATTAAPTTTTTTATTATTVPAGGPYLVDEGDFFPAPYPGSLDAHGSGCVTGGTGLLPDGVWFGFAETLSSGTIGFDLVCFYTGPVADTKAAEDGVEVIDAIYVRNLNPNTYPVPIATTARVWYIDATSPSMTDEIPLAAWPHPGSYVPYPCDYCPVWLYVNDGEATGIVEQYLP